MYSDSFGNEKPIIIQVKSLKEMLTEISSEGFTLIVADDESFQIDFETCFLNHLKEIEPEEKRERYREYRTVGQRNISENFIEFFTDPITRLEFDSINDFHELRHRIRRLRWRTIDLT